MVCTANTEVFILDSKNIDRLIPRRNQGSSTVELLRERVEDKLTTRLNTNLGRGVRLYDRLLEKVGPVTCILYKLIWGGVSIDLLTCRVKEKNERTWGLFHKRSYD